MHRCCAKCAIEFDRRFIPIEHSPFHPAAAAIARDLRKLDKQGATITFATLLWLHEQIFQIEPRPSEPRGEIIKENGKPDRCIAFKRKKHFCRRPFTEQNIDQLFFRCSDFVWRALIRSQIANELQNDWHVRDPSRTDLEIFNSVHLDTDCRRRGNACNW